MTKKKGTINPILPKPVVNATRQLPVKGDAAYIGDNHTLLAALNERLSIAPGHTAIVDCGFSVKLPPSLRIEVKLIQELALRGVCGRLADVSTDADDYMRVKVLVSNLGKTIIAFEDKDRVAEFFLVPIWEFEFVEYT